MHGSCTRAVGHGLSPASGGRCRASHTIDAAERRTATPGPHDTDTVRAIVQHPTLSGTRSP